MSSPNVAEQISLFRSQVERRRFDEGTLRILESVLVSRDVTSMLQVRSSLREFMRRESLSILNEISEKSIQDKLFALEFLVRASALSGDVESCLALTYEGLVLRELKSAGSQWLQVSHMEWMAFAEHSLHNGFNAIARKACENALTSFQMNGMIDTPADDFTEHAEVIRKIKRLMDDSLSSTSISVQAQASEYLRKKTVEMRTTQALDCKETHCSGSTLFRDGIKERNVRKLRLLKSFN